MKGHVIIEVEAEEMIAIVQYYLNKELFTCDMSRSRHLANVTDVRQRSNGNFVIEFDGQMPKTLKQLEAEHATNNPA